MTTKTRRITRLLVALLFAYAMGALTCYLVYPKVEVRPYIELPKTNVPPFKE